ncbi:MAG: porin, partial [Kiloniellales bacterium]
SDVENWDVGVTYATGPWTVGVTYLNSEAETSDGDDELDAFVIAGTYNLGPGVNVWAGVKWYDFEDALGAGDSENEATFGMIGTSISF